MKTKTQRILLIVAIVIFALITLFTFTSCKKQYTCNCQIIERQCIQKRDKHTGFIQTVSCNDSIVDNTIDNIGNNTKQQATNKCHNKQKTITFHDTIVVYEIANCEIK